MLLLSRGRSTFPNTRIWSTPAGQWTRTRLCNNSYLHGGCCSDRFGGERIDTFEGRRPHSRQRLQTHLTHRSAGAERHEIWRGSMMGSKSREEKNGTRTKHGQKTMGKTYFLHFYSSLNFPNDSHRHYYQDSLIRKRLLTPDSRIFQVFCDDMQYFYWHWTVLIYHGYNYLLVIFNNPVRFF